MRERVSERERVRERMNASAHIVAYKVSRACFGSSANSMRFQNRSQPSLSLPLSLSLSLSLSLFLSISYSHTHSLALTLCSRDMLCFISIKKLIYSKYLFLIVYFQWFVILSIFYWHNQACLLLYFIPFYI